MTDSPMFLSTIGADKYPIWARRRADSGSTLNEIWRFSRFGGTDPAAALRAACAAAVADLDIASVYTSGWISPVGDIKYASAECLRAERNAEHTRISPLCQDDE
ncbi:MAG: hypothetical protein H5T78_08860 [Nocardia sp.]|nr:hypothetical protein [Nocardia sp.]